MGIVDGSPAESPVVGFVAAPGCNTQSLEEIELIGPCLTGSSDSAA